MATEQEVNSVVNQVYNGTLEAAIKKNSRYVLGGMLIGSLSMFLIASLSGKCTKCALFWGAVGGGSTAYLIATAPKGVGDKK
ncbi:MAG: hypothetical protein COA79_20295 [Planctomycetota bacterium]|nr:MAG: hypothetical protein COA79_20295 [Planctomycetota bacterium]